MGMFTSTMRFTGLSGIDTESMVSQLMKSESLKYNRLKQQSQLLQWSQTQYRDTSEFMKGFQTDILGLNSKNSINLAGSFANTIATATLNGKETDLITLGNTSSASGSHKLTIEQLADRDKYVSNEFSGVVTGTDKVDIEKLKAGDSFSLSLDGITKNIEFSQEDLDRINGDGAELEKVLNEKLKSSFGSDQNGDNKVTAAMTDGVLSFKPASGHSLKVTEGTQRQSSEKADKPFDKEAIFGEEEVDEDGNVVVKDKEMTINVNGKDVVFTLKSNMTNSQITKTINSAIEEQSDVKGNKLQASFDADGVITFKANNTDEDIKVTGAGLSDLGFEKATLEFGNTNVLSDLSIKDGSTSDFDMTTTVGSALGITGESQLTVNGKTITIKEDMTMKQLMSAFSSIAGVTMTYSATSQRFQLEGDQTGELAAISFGGDTKILEALGINEENRITKAQDAIFQYDGTTTTRSSNDIKMDGINFTINGVTKEGDEILIGVQKDANASKELITNFVAKYNEVLGLLRNTTSTSRPKQDNYSYYNPLTEEEKAGMSDAQIQTWETQAKKGLLYNDPILNKINDDMRASVYKAVELSDGTSMSLYELGITTSADYTKGGELVIDEEKLAKALEENGDKIVEFFTKTSESTGSAVQGAKDAGIAQRLDSIFKDAVGTMGTLAEKAGFAESISADNNVLSKEIKKQGELMADMYKSLARKEAYYYNMFSRMESVVSQNNNTLAYLQSM